MSSRSLPIPTRLLGVTLCLVLSALSTAYAATSLFGNSYAVVIGIDDYKHSRVWPDLPYANKDARGMATFLQNQGFEVRTLYDREATQRAIISALEDHLAPRLKENDRVLFFFSGHGETRPYGNEDHGYIVPQDGDKWPSTWISMEKLRELAWKMGAARHQLFIFDACFGGLFAAKGPLSTRDPDMPGYIETVSKDKARQYLTAGGAREKVRAGGPKGYSYFTGYLLEALKQGKADTYRDGYITASELVAWLEPAASNPDHTPRGGTLGGHEQGDFLFQSPFPAAARAKEPTGPFVGLKAGAREDVVPVEEPYLAVKNARIRARPTVQSDTVGIIKKDSRVWVAGQVRNQEWYLVEHAETKGFVYRRLLRAATAAQPTPPSSGLGTDMIRIKGGCFEMGSPKREAGRQDDEHQHRVCVDDFALGQHEVTVDEFRQFVNATSYRTEAEKGEGCWVWTGENYDLDATKHWQEPGFSQDDRHPVVCVSWNDAQAYLEWLSQETGRKYRLPTEAEWEYAARAGTTTARFWGDDPDQACRFGNVADEAAKEEYPKWTIHACRDGSVYTAPVGTFEPNDFDLHDMLGNAWEWTCSTYDEKYGGAEQRCAPAEDSGRRVVRGGSWDGKPGRVRSAYRFRVTQGSRGGLGFRLAQDL